MPPSRKFTTIPGAPPRGVLSRFAPDAALLAGVPEPDALAMAGVIAPPEGDAAPGPQAQHPGRRASSERGLAEFIQEQPDP
jgi:hypothetical protein